MNKNVPLERKAVVPDLFEGKSLAFRKVGWIHGAGSPDLTGHCRISIYI